MTLTNDVVCEKLNKETILDNYVTRALDEGTYPRTPSNEHFLGESQCLPRISRGINSITEVREEWATSRNR